jgi:hypothetical protein
MEHLQSCVFKIAIVAVETSAQRLSKGVALVAQRRCSSNASASMSSASITLTQIVQQFAAEAAQVSNSQCAGVQVLESSGACAAQVALILIVIYKQLHM